jgi:hypothetical protein
VQVSIVSGEASFGVAIDGAILCVMLGPG